MITIQPPADLDDLDRVLREAKEQSVLELLREGKVSSGRAAELLGTTKHDVLVWMSARGIPVFPEMTAEELLAEVGDIKRALGCE